jgi:magnesium-transporting ATPase (P-type)
MNDPRAVSTTEEASGESVNQELEQANPELLWHATVSEEVLKRLRVDERGLAGAEAARRLAEHGPNALPEQKRRGPLLRFLSHFNNLLIYVLMGAAALSALLGHFLDMGVILLVVVANAVIGFIQEGRAEKSLAAIRSLIAPKATVLRDGMKQSVTAAELVPGDVVMLEAGDRVAADLRLFRARNLHVDEAILTGESVPVEKATAPVEDAAPVGDRRSMAFSGTMITAGHGEGVVVATGKDTELGRISTLMSKVETLTTPLLRQMNVFARQLTLAILSVASLVFVYALFVQSKPWTEVFMPIVALAVAAIPEGLPAVMTITLAIGVQRMARRHAIIRQLPAVETLGSVSVICSDKTGTFTRNEMTVRSIALADEEVEVTGVGYEPSGAFKFGETAQDPEEDSVLRELALAALLCNDAELQARNGDWYVVGDPMEGALVSFAAKAGYEAAETRKKWHRLDIIPFDARHRFMATLHEGGEGHVAYLKGAPERVLGMCGTERTRKGDVPLSPDWQARVDALASRGERVLALAAKAVPSDLTDLEHGHVESGLVLLGIVGLIDPPREEAIQAVAECRGAGIGVKMITGDHKATASAIAAQLGLEHYDRVASGQDIDDLSDGELQELAHNADVFARTSPEHKLRIVTALQADGDVVAMTGDGVNDAPALKRADVGVAMGNKGTEAAKEAAEMILADDNFASIVAAVREGRTVYDNLRKCITFLLPINGGESGAILVAILLGVVLPISPLQILWINMVSSVALALTLAFEPTEPNVMGRPPRSAREQLLSGFLLWRIALVSVLFLAGIFGMFAWAIERGLSVEEARTIAVNTLVVMEIFYLFSVRYLHMTSLSWQGVLGTPAVLIGVGAVVVAQFLFTYAPFMQVLFDTRPVALMDGLVIVGIGVLLLIVLEAEKLVRHSFKRGGERARPLPA